MFIPNRIIFQKGSLDYDMSRRILERFSNNKNIEIIHLSTNRYNEHIPGDDLYTLYRGALLRETVLGVYIEQ